ncbi:MAG: DUF2029 domain-containing protein [Chloroflexota bacterium]|nr:DUF2029 domain-containing protein [Chloroflexota bacterium]
MRSLLRGRVLYSAGILAMGLAAAGATDLLNKPFGYDLAAYLIAARRLLAGAQIYPHEPVFGPFGQFFYPPVIAAAFIPFLLSPYAGALAWTLGLFAIAAGFGRSLVCGHDRQTRPWVAAAFVFFPPLLWDLNLGNVTMLAVVVTVLAWEQRERPAVSGGLLALSLALKPLGMTLPVYFLVSGRWRTTAWAMAISVGVVVLTWPWLGQYWLDYVRLVGMLVNAPPGRDSNIIPPELFSVPERLLLPVLALCTAVWAGLQARRPALAGHAFRLTLASSPLVSTTVWYPYLVATLPLLLHAGSPAVRWSGGFVKSARVLLWGILVAQFVRSPGLTVQLLGVLALVLVGSIPLARSAPAQTTDAEVAALATAPS